MLFQGLNLQGHYQFPCANLFLFETHLNFVIFSNLRGKRKSACIVSKINISLPIVLDFKMVRNSPYTLAFFWHETRATKHLQLWSECFWHSWFGPKPQEGVECGIWKLLKTEKGTCLHVPVLSAFEVSISPRIYFPFLATITSVCISLQLLQPDKEIPFTDGTYLHVGMQQWKKTPSLPRVMFSNTPEWW